MIGSSSSVVRTVSRLPRVKMVERFLNVALEEKKLETLLRSEQTAWIIHTTCTHTPHHRVVPGDGSCA